MDQKNSINYPLQFAILLGLLGIFIILSSVLVMFLGSTMLHVPLKQVIAAMNRPENADISRFLNTTASLLAFLLPALILARIISKRPFTQLGFNSAISTRQILLVVVITLASMVLSGALGELNERIPIPAKWWAKAKALEETYKAAMMAMAQMKNGTDYLVSLIVLAAAPAVFEEVLFRGGFQQVFVGWTKNKWAGIIITSLLFSAIHFSYFGFLPRVALGMVLGLIFYYSKNIWLNIILHFLNNAFVVTQLYLLSRQGKPIEKTIDETMPIWWGAIGLMLLVVFFRAFRQQSEKVLVAEEKNIYSSHENMIS
jgi:membrane protease YdiL (CAAX protease family)